MINKIESVENKDRFYSVIMISILLMFLMPIGKINPTTETQKQMEYEEMRKEALFYARSCGIKGDSEVIKRAFDYSVRFCMRWELVVRWIHSESSFIPSATSCADAKGLTQLMDATANYIGKILVYSGMIGLTLKEEERLRQSKYNLYEVEDNLLIGFAYLKFLSLCSENPEEALARYLAGKRWLEFLDSRYVQHITDGKPIICESIL